jgi:hypothetical protein
MNHSNITDERAARRFHQLAVLERQLAIKQNDLLLSKAHSRELKEQIDGLIQRIRAAARDEGELPLFDLDGGDE